MEEFLDQQEAARKKYAPLVARISAPELVGLADVIAEAMHEENELYKQRRQSASDRVLLASAILLQDMERAVRGGDDEQEA